MGGAKNGITDGDGGENLVFHIHIYRWPLYLLLSRMTNFVTG
jgi:hypothetical protein